MRAVREILCNVFGGCPKRHICSLRQVGAKTCTQGPYQYCGKYRLEDYSKKSKRLMAEVEA